MTMSIPNCIAVQQMFHDMLEADFEEYNSRNERYPESYTVRILKEVEDDFQQAKIRHSKITVSKSPEAKDYLESGLFTKLRTLFRNFTRVLHEHRPEQKSTVDITDATTQNISKNDLHSTSVHLRLPPLQLEVFSGVYEEWTSFKNMFNSAIHNNTCLEPIEKLRYLHSYLKGEALNVIKGLDINDESYDAAIQLLYSRYDDNKRLVDSHLDQIFKSPPVKYDTKSIRKLIDTISDAKLALQKLKFDLNDYVIIYQIVEKLPVKMLGSWDETLGKSTELPTWQEFIEFLETKCRTLERLEQRTHDTKAFSSDRKPTKTFHVNSQRTNNSNKVNNKQISKGFKKQKLECLFCKESHYLNQCSKFKDLPIDSRLDFVKKNKLCSNCLKKAHIAKDCRYKITCTVCKKRHNTILHRYQNTNNNNSANINIDNSQSENHPSTSRNFHVNSGEKLLGTAQVKATNSSGFSLLVRSLIDPCSMDNYITLETVKSLKLQKYYEPTIYSTLGSDEGNECQFKVDLTIQSIHTKFSMEISAVVVDKITADLPSVKIAIDNLDDIKSELKLADQHFNKPCAINMLLGVDIHTSTKINESKRLAEYLLAENSQLGFIIRGSVDEEHNSHSLVALTKTVTNVQLEKQIQKFWKSEEIEVNTAVHPDEQLCEEIFNASLQRLPNGDLSVDLPFHQNIEPKMGATRYMAIRRLLNLEKKFKNNPELRIDYQKQLQEYIDMGHMVQVQQNVEEEDYVCYLPHHAVMKESSTTTKMRIVFDASCRGSDGTSLNDHLMTGPKLQTDIQDVIFNWRQLPYTITSDVAKMYRMFRVNEKHREYQRIVWRFSENDPISD